MDKSVGEGVQIPLLDIGARKRLCKEYEDAFRDAMRWEARSWDAKNKAEKEKYRALFMRTLDRATFIERLDGVLNLGVGRELVRIRYEAYQEQRAGIDVTNRERLIAALLGVLPDDEAGEVIDKAIVCPVPEILDQEDAVCEPLVRANKWSGVTETMCHTCRQKMLDTLWKPLEEGEKEDDSKAKTDTN